MTLGNAQRAFAQEAARLILRAYETGYQVTFGDAYRDPRSHGELGIFKAYGHASSNHKQRLAIDLNLFRDGEYLTTTEAHRPLGEWWENRGKERKLALRWGGTFNNPDGNHYELVWPEPR